MIIDKYNLLFTTINIADNKKHVSISTTKDPLLNYHLGGYLLGQSIAFLTDDVLPEIENALTGQAFDSDAGETLSFLTIERMSSNFSALDESKPDISIPTKDLRDIIVEWTKWVITNNLQNAIS